MQEPGGKAAPVFPVTFRDKGDGEENRKAGQEGKREERKGGRAEERIKEKLGESVGLEQAFS